MVEWKKLGEISNLVRGKVISKDYIRDHEGLYPVYSSQTANNGILGTIDSYMFEGSYLTWTTDGAYAGTVFRRNGKFNITNVCGLIDLRTNKVNQDFLFYWLSLVAKDYVIEGMGNPKLMSNVASNIKIPIPSHSEQNRIVGILDTFTSSIDNLKKQIALRKKQLEQYRNELLDLEGHEGVSMRPLGDLCEIIRGNGVQKTDFIEKGVGCIHYGQIYTHYGLFTYTTNKFVSEATAAKAKKASKGDIIMTSTSENVEDVCKSVAYLGDDDIAVSSHALILKHNLDPKYLAHCTATYNFFKQKYKLAHGAKVVEIKPEEVAKIKIPVVAKPGQSLIVFILDKFEAIIANLEKQLEFRQKQYEYYRNQLLTFE